MKNVIELAKLAKEIYRATNELLQIVVHIKSLTKKAKTLENVKQNVYAKEYKLLEALDRIELAITNLINWGNDVAPTA